MTTTCFICGLKISNAEGYMLSYLNTGKENNMAVITCTKYHKKKMLRQTQKDADIQFQYRKLMELEKRIESLEGNSFPIWNIFDQMRKQQLNPNGHPLGCPCNGCYRL